LFEKWVELNRTERQIDNISDNRNQNRAQLRTATTKLSQYQLVEDTHHHKLLVRIRPGSLHTGDKVKFDIVEVDKVKFNFANFDFVDFDNVALLTLFCRNSTVAGSFNFVEQLSNDILYEYLLGTS